MGADHSKPAAPESQAHKDDQPTGRLDMAAVNETRATKEERGARYTVEDGLSPTPLSVKEGDASGPPQQDRLEGARDPDEAPETAAPSTSLATQEEQQEIDRVRQEVMRAMATASGGSSSSSAPTISSSPPSATARPALTISPSSRPPPSPARSTSIASAAIPEDLALILQSGIHEVPTEPNLELERLRMRVEASRRTGTGRTTDGSAISIDGQPEGEGDGDALGMAPGKKRKRNGSTSSTSSASSSGSSSVTSTSSSSSSSAASSDSEEAANEDEGQAADYYNDDDEEEAPVPVGPGAFATKHEMVVPDVLKPDVDVVPSEMPITFIGRVHSVVDSVVVVEAFPPSAETDDEKNQGRERGSSDSDVGARMGASASASGKETGRAMEELKVLDTESLLCFADRTVLGLVFETFGPTTAPLYSIRFDSATSLRTQHPSLQPGEPVYHVPSRSSYVFTRLLVKQKGSDASNQWDEEPELHELEFSDDEEEAKWRRELKMKKKGGKAHEGASGGAGPAGPAGRRGGRGGAGGKRGAYRPGSVGVRSAAAGAGSSLTRRDLDAPAPQDVAMSSAPPLMYDPDDLGYAFLARRAAPSPLAGMGAPSGTQPTEGYDPTHAAVPLPPRSSYPPQPPSYY